MTDALATDHSAAGGLAARSAAESGSSPMIAPALAVSGVLAVALAAALMMLFPATEESEVAAVSLARYLANPFCLGIFVLGGWAVLYGALMLWGAALERRALLTGADGAPVVRRITAAMEGAALLRSQSATEVSLEAQLASDRFEGYRALRAAPLGYAIWALPLFGFIGTVIGISGAIGGLGAVFADTGREEALADVLGALRYAFDTTFVGLAAVIPAMALAAMLRSRSEFVRHAIVVHVMRAR